MATDRQASWDARAYIDKIHRQTLAWDVRTKHVTFVEVPTLPHVRGIALYGPGATLFTLGTNSMVQQFDLANDPPVMVSNVHHPAALLPPSPPVSIEEAKKQEASMLLRNAIVGVPPNMDMSSGDDDRMSPLARIARQTNPIEEFRPSAERADTSSPVSSRSRTSNSTVSSRSSADSRERTYGGRTNRVSRAATSRSEATTMSFGSSVHTKQPSIISSRESISISSTSSASHGYRRRGGSRLRHEVQASPADSTTVADLFKFTRARLSDIPYRHPQALDDTHLTNDDLRRQMLSTIFGWNGEANSLIQDEISRHPIGTPCRLLLSKWLGEIDTDVIASNVDSMTSSDWMLLALSGIGGTAAQSKMARAYVQRLLEKGDVHTAATIMIGMGDNNDAIEIYVSHKRYMEALILTCLVFPADWSRQAELVRKWGEWAVQHGQQQLAVRCFSCTGTESTEPWASPSAQQATFSRLHTQSIPELLSPPLSPPGVRGPQRSIAKTSALKLITSFGNHNVNAKFFGVSGEDEPTPINGAAGVTPIAESALSAGSEPGQTAFMRPVNRSVYNTPASARTATPGGFGRQRLASIGEMPTDVVPRVRLEAINPNSLTTSGAGLGSVTKLSSGSEYTSNTPLRVRAESTEPTTARRTKTPALPSPNPDTFDAMKRNARARNGSRDRKPDGLQIQWPPVASILSGEYMSPDISTASSRQTDVSNSSSRRAGPQSIASLTNTSNARSPSISERSGYSRGTASPAITGRSLDQYISSLESAQHHAQRDRPDSDKRGRSARTRSNSRQPKTRVPSEDRSRSVANYIQPPKRSPTSPIPMSPEDIRQLSALGSALDAQSDQRSTKSSHAQRDVSQTRSTRSSSKLRRGSLSEQGPPLCIKPLSRTSSRNHNRRTSGSNALVDSSDARGRSQGRVGSTAPRSPTSPQPMSAVSLNRAFTLDDADDLADLQRARDDRERFRSRQRSSSRLREKGSHGAGNQSPERSRRDRSGSRRPSDRERSKSGARRAQTAEGPHVGHARSYSEQKVGDFSIKDERVLKREQAARELEERRKSLASRTSTQAIMHPTEISLSPVAYQLPSMKFPDSRQYAASPPAEPAGPHSAFPMSSQIGLPATPRAMRHPKFDPDGSMIPAVPQIPPRFDTAPPPQSHEQVEALQAKDQSPLNSLLLPKTVYQAAPRRLPPRSASAPIREEAVVIPNGLPLHPAFRRGLSPSVSSRLPRPNASSTSLVSPAKFSKGYEGVGRVSLDESDNDRAPYTGRDPLPPPPPPPPPLIPELQHLARPPPPPPPPLYQHGLHGANTHSIVSGTSGASGVSNVSSGSGVIEIVMDEDEEPTRTLSDSKMATASTHVPRTIAVPQLNTGIPVASQTTRNFPLTTSPLSRRNTHTRNASETEITASTSISGRFSRAAERIRSASRGRTTNDKDKLTKSPIETQISPYDQFGGPWGPRANTTSPMTARGEIPPMPRGNAVQEHAERAVERHPREVRASAMRAMEMEGGMI